MTDEKDETPIQSFFEKPAAFGLIVQMDTEQGNIKAEINEKLVYSPRSVGPLLTEAQNIGVIEEAQMRVGDHPRSTRYELTGRGKEIRSWLERLDVDERYQRHLEAWQALDDVLPNARAIIQEEIIRDESADSWSASGMPSVDPEEEFADEGQPNSSPKASESDEGLVDVRDEEEREGGEDLGRTETWGTEPDNGDEETS